MSTIYVVVAIGEYAWGETEIKLATLSKEKAEAKVKELRDKLPIILQAQNELRDYDAKIRSEIQYPKYPSLLTNWLNKDKVDEYYQDERKTRDEIEKLYDLKRTDLKDKYDLHKCGLMDQFEVVSKNSEYQIQEFQDE